MKWKQIIAGLSALTMSAFLFGCAAEGDGISGGTSSEEETLSSGVTQAEYSEEDLDDSWEEDSCTKILLQGTSASVEGSGVSVSGQIVTISAAGNYLVSGSLENGQILVDAGKEDLIRIILNGAEIHCENSAPLYSKQAGKTLVILSAGSENRLSDGESYDYTENRNALTALQQQVNTLVSGDASSAIESFNEIIAFLANVEDTQTLQGIIAGLNQSITNVQQAIPTRLSQLQNDDHTVKDAAYVHTDNNYSNEEKTKVSDSLRLKEYVDVESLAALPSSPYNLRFKYTSKSPQAINFADIASVPEMQEFYLSILNSSGSDFDQPVPNGSGWQSEESSVTFPNGKPTGVSLKKEHGIIVVRV